MKKLPKVESNPVVLTRVYVSIPKQTDASNEVGIVRASESSKSGFLLDWLAGADGWNANSRAKGNRVERTI